MSTTQYSFATRQRGIGFSSVIAIIGLVAFFGTILLKIGPLYMNFWTVKSIMEDTATTYDIKKDGGGRGIITAVEKRLDVNSIETVKGTDFQIERMSDRQFKLLLGYEQRVHLFFNIDAIVLFSYQVEVGSE